MQITHGIELQIERSIQTFPLTDKHMYQVTSGDIHLQTITFKAK